MFKIKELLKIPAFWVIFVLITFGVVILLILSREEKNGYLLLSNISSYTCNKNSCKDTPNEEIDTTKNFIVYKANQNIGTYKLKYINKWNFFDLNNNWQNIGDSFIAGSSSLELKVQDFDTRKMTKEELSLLDKHLKENKIGSYSQLEQNEVLEYDFNKNGKNEKIILASNVNEETGDDKLFVIVISVINNKSSVLHLEIFNQNENYEVPAYRIKGIINVMNNKEDYLVLLKGYFSEVGIPTNYIYQLTKNNFENIVESK